MIKSQLLMEIDTALSLSVLSFDNHIVMSYVSHVLPKLGMILSTKDNYAALLLHVHKSHKQDTNHQAHYSGKEKSTK